MDTVPMPKPIPPAPTQLKILSNGYLGFIHYLLGGLIFPIIIGWASKIILNPIPQGTVAIYVGYAFALFGVWLGVWYSAKILKKRYQINNPKKVAYIATVWNFVLIAFVIIVLGSVILNVEQQTGKTSLGFGESAGAYGLQIIEFIVQMFLFYWLSKKYLSQASTPKLVEVAV